MKNKLFEKKQNNKKIVAKCGFITGDPDIDAVTRLFWPVNVKSVKSKQNYYFLLVLSLHSMIKILQFQEIM